MKANPFFRRLEFSLFSRQQAGPGRCWSPGFVLMLAALFLVSTADWSEAKGPKHGRGHKSKHEKKVKIKHDGVEIEHEIEHEVEYENEFHEDYCMPHGLAKQGKMPEGLAKKGKIPPGWSKRCKGRPGHPVGVKTHHETKKVVKIKKGKNPCRSVVEVPSGDDKLGKVATGAAMGGTMGGVIGSATGEEKEGAVFGAVVGGIIGAAAGEDGNGGKKKVTVGDCD